MTISDHPVKFFLNYATPKIHKTSNPLRPIVDCTGSIGYNVSRALADILGPMVGRTIHHVNNSFDLAEDLPVS